MASQGQKRDISDFFRPYTRSGPSPSAEERPRKKEARGDGRAILKTPTSASRFKHVNTSPTKSPKRPLSGSSVSMPIRSPRPSPQPKKSSVYRSGSLFQTQTKSTKTPPPSPFPFTFTNLPGSARSDLKESNEITVRDSDDDTDSLVSLEDIFGRRRQDPPTSSSSPSEVGDSQESERVELLRLFTGGRSVPLIGKEKIRALAAREREHRPNFNALVDDHFADEDIEGHRAKAEAVYNAAEEETEFSKRQTDVNRNLLVSIMDGSDGADNATRLMHAVERTGAISTEKCYSFFGTGENTVWQEKPASDDHTGEPEDDCSDFDTQLCPWTQGDTEARSRAFVSGSMAELAARGKAPATLLDWTFNRILTESHDELRESYVQCIKRASPYWTRTSLTARHIRHSFSVLGVPDHVLEDNEIECACYVLRRERARDPRYLLSFFDVLHGVADDLEFEALSKLVSSIARLSVDSNCMSNGDICTAVEATFSRLLSLRLPQAQEHVAQRLNSDIGRHLKEPALQVELLMHILPTSPAAAQLRMALAHHFLRHQSPHQKWKPPTALPDLDLLQNVLASPDFDTSLRPRDDPVDYATQLATTHILDVAIADGGRPMSFTSRADEVRFNQKIDALTDSVNVAVSCIVDTGASFMRRTEAKQVLLSLHSRLLHAVRTEARPKKNILGGKGVGHENMREQRFMDKFFDRSKPNHSDVVHDTPTTSQMSQSEQQIRQQLQP